MKDYSDTQLEQDLTAALKSQAAKRAMIQTWESELTDGARRRRLTRPVWWPVSLAAIACAAALVMLFRPAPAADPVFVMPDFASAGDCCRGGDDARERLDCMIARGDYAAALTMADSLIAEADNLAASFGDGPLSERDRYRRDLAADDHYELTWRRINLLMGLGRRADALRELKSFSASAGRYRQCADSLYRVFN